MPSDQHPEIGGALDAGTSEQRSPDKNETARFAKELADHWRPPTPGAAEPTIPNTRLPTHLRAQAPPLVLPPPPQLIVEAAAVSRSRASKRRPSLGVAITPTADGFVIGPPHNDCDAWEAMLCDLFGTSSISTAKFYLDQLVRVCRTVHDEGMGQNVPSTNDLLACLSIVAGARPRDEAEAAIAVGMVAMHFLSMRLATEALSGIQVRHQDAALAAKLARTAAMQADTLANRRGRKTQQRITVKQERHEHHHQHVHVTGGGTETGNQPHGPAAIKIVDADPAVTRAASRDGSSPTMLGKHAERNGLPMPGGEGEGALPHARRGVRKRRTPG